MEFTKKYIYSKEFLLKKEIPTHEERIKIIQAIGYNEYQMGVGYIKVDITKWNEKKTLSFYKDWKKGTKEILWIGMEGDK